MRFFILPSAIILTLVSTVIPTGHVRAETSPMCTTTMGGTRDLGWLDELSNALSAKVARIPAEVPSPKAPSPKAPSPTPKPEKTKVAVVKDPPVGESDRYDLEEPEIGRLRKSALAAAGKCRKGICGTKHSKYLCYRGVKDALVGAGMVKSVWSEEAASDAHQKHSLEDRGFRDVLAEGYDSGNAPIGSVLVYSGGKYRCRDHGHRKTCGHIEIKLSANLYCSDYCKDRPANDYLSRKLIGIYVKK